MDNAITRIHSPTLAKRDVFEPEGADIPAAIRSIPIREELLIEISQLLLWLIREMLRLLMTTQLQLAQRLFVKFDTNQVI
jgi:hypothetical protein